LSLTFILISCTNLKEVRDYASESAKLSAYTELTTRFRDTYEREQPYLYDEADRLAQANDKKRKAAYNDLLQIHKTVSLYMTTLASLAGEDTFDLTKEVDSLANGIKTYPDIGIDEKQVNAISNITKIITKWITSSYQENAVRDMLKESNTDLQTTLNGMLSIVSYYKRTNYNERKDVLGIFEIGLPFTTDPKDRLLAILARVNQQSKIAEYNNAEQKYNDAEKGIKSIIEGHKKLLENVDHLSSDEAKVIISKFAKDIKAIRENLQTVNLK
jgi:hypothetical protein